MSIPDAATQPFIKEPSGGDTLAQGTDETKNRVDKDYFLRNASAKIIPTPTRITSNPGDFDG